MSAAADVVHAEFGCAAASGGGGEGRCTHGDVLYASGLVDGWVGRG